MSDHSSSSETSSSDSPHSPSTSETETSSDDEDVIVDVITISPPEPESLPAVTKRIRVAIDLTLIAIPEVTDPVTTRDSLNVEDTGNPIVGLPCNETHVMHVPTSAEMTDHHVVIPAHADNRLPRETLWVPRQRNLSSEHRRRRVADNAKPY
jgi:hypothetical protein